LAHSSWKTRCCGSKAISWPGAQALASSSVWVPMFAPASTTVMPGFTSWRKTSASASQYSP
jgi:hypothetical protein